MINSNKPRDIVDNEKVSDLALKIINCKIEEYLVLEDQSIKLFISNEEMLKYSSSDYEILVYREENMKFLNDNIKKMTEIKRDIKYLDENNMFLLRELPRFDSIFLNDNKEEKDHNKNNYMNDILQESILIDNNIKNKDFEDNINNVRIDIDKKDIHMSNNNIDISDKYNTENSIIHDIEL